MWFCAGETSRVLALSLAFAAENIKNLPLALRALKKNWARLESPSLPISRSGSWPQREGLLSPAARQIYRRKFPPVGFIRSLFNHEWFYWCAVNETRSRHMKRDLNCFDPNSIELCIFCKLYFDFFLSPVFKYKALVGDLSSFIRALYQGRIFLTATEQKRYRLVLLWAHALQSFYFFVLFHGVCKPCNDSYVLELHLWRARPETSGDWTHKYHQSRRHFCSLPVFCTEHFFIHFTYFLSSEFFFPLFVCFNILWRLATIHALDDTLDRDANCSRQNDVTWWIFCRETSRAHFCRRKHKKSTARAQSRSWKNLRSTCRQV